VPTPTAPVLTETATHVFAAPQVVGTTHVSGVSGLGQVTLALIVVLVAVFAFAWVARRVRGMGSRVGNAIDVLAEMPLGQKERAVLLKVGTTQILLGVAPGRVTTLHVLSEPIELPKPEAGDSRPNFRALLMRSLGK
jgi:flagellar protein FliO/FliZ